VVVGVGVWARLRQPTSVFWQELQGKQPLTTPTDGTGVLRLAYGVRAVLWGQWLVAVVVRVDPGAVRFDPNRVMCHGFRVPSQYSAYSVSVIGRCRLM